MLSIPFYQKEWLEVDLLQIAKEISLPSNQVANSYFYIDQCLYFRKDISVPYSDKNPVKELPVEFLNLDFDNIVPHISPILVDKQKKRAFKGLSVSK